MLALDMNFALGAGGLIVGLLGIAIALVTYYASQRERYPIFHVARQRAPVVDAAAAVENLQVTYLGEPIVGRSVYLVEVFFWNAGRQPILAADVLRRLEVVITPTTTTILTAKVTTQSRPFINVRITPNPDAFNRWWIDFDVLDHRDGFMLTLLCASEPGLERHGLSTAIEGAILSVQRITKVDIAHRQPIVARRRRVLIWAAAVAVIAGALWYPSNSYLADVTWGTVAKSVRSISIFCLWGCLLFFLSSLIDGWWPWRGTTLPTSLTD